MIKIFQSMKTRQFT